MTDDNLDQHPSLREHLGLRERVTVLEGGQVNVLAMLSRIEARQLVPPTPPPAPQESAAALALHRALDAFDKRANSGGSSSPIMVGLALIGTAAIGAVIVYMLGIHR